MLAQRGWKSNPSPRRGFTVVEASRELRDSPVVVSVHDSSRGVRLFRSALDEAMSRSRDLVVLDFGKTSLREELGNASTEIDPRERSAMRALWANPHVRVVRMESTAADLEETISYCEIVKASLLIVAADQIGTIDPDLSDRIFNGDFDVLVVTDHPAADRLVDESSQEE